MCFSASASFIVGGSLTAFGVITLQRTTTRSELPFAAIPLLFGIQQSIEGVLWLSIHHDLALIQTIATYLFTLFSHIVWPILLPYAVARMEGPPEKMAAWRRKAMLGFRFTGIVVAILLLALVASQPLTAVADKHIVYVMPLSYGWPMVALYSVATCIVAIFSSHAMIRLFGLAALASFFIAYWFYTQAFVSVWCFFAAALSLIIDLHFRRARRADALQAAVA